MVCWTAKPAAGTSRISQSSAPAGQHVGDRDEERQDDRRDDHGDRDRAAAQHGAEGEGEDGGDGEQAAVPATMRTTVSRFTGYR